MVFTPQSQNGVVDFVGRIQMIGWLLAGSEIIGNLLEMYLSRP